MEQKHMREKEMMQRENGSEINSLKERNIRLLKEKGELEEEVTKLKSSIVNTKLKSEEDIAWNHYVFTFVSGKTDFIILAPGFQSYLG